MSDSNIKMTLSCKKCGGDTLVLPDDATDDSLAICRACGVEAGRWGDIKVASTRAAKDHLAKELRRIFGEAFKGNRHARNK